MFRINKYKIKITKGDDAIFRVHTLNGEGSEVDLTNCSLVMTVRKTAESEVLFSNEADNEGYIAINHSDTANAQCGQYLYDIQCTDEAGKISTLVKNYFEITEEITR